MCKLRGGPNRKHAITAYIVRPHPLTNRGYALKTENNLNPPLPFRNTFNRPIYFKIYKVHFFKTVRASSTLAQNRIYDWILPTTRLRQRCSQSNLIPVTWYMSSLSIEVVTFKQFPKIFSSSTAGSSLIDTSLAEPA